MPSALLYINRFDLSLSLSQRCLFFYHVSTVVTETHREAAEFLFNLSSAQVIARHAASFSSIAHAVTQLIIGSRTIIARRYTNTAAHAHASIADLLTDTAVQSPLLSG